MDHLEAFGTFTYARNASGAQRCESIKMGDYKMVKKVIYWVQQEIDDTRQNFSKRLQNCDVKNVNPFQVVKDSIEIVNNTDTVDTSLCANGEGEEPTVKMISNGNSRLVNVLRKHFGRSFCKSFLKF